MRKKLVLSSDHVVNAGKAALLMVFASQVTFTLFTTGFHISAAIIVLVMITFFQLKFPILLSTLFAIPGIIALRMLLHGLSAGGDFAT